jgi:hypothetical protein
MKTTQYPYLQKNLILSALAVFGALVATHSQATTVSGGALILNINGMP